MNASKKSKRRRRRTLAAVVAAALVIAIVFFAYVGGYSRAGAAAVMAQASANVMQFDGGISFGDTDSDVGLIFYPGGKVEYTAYAPLLSKLSERGILCVAVEMPFNLAVLDQNAANEITALFPDVDSWYIGGHSLGGAMAAGCAADSPGRYKGLVLLAAYSTEPLSGAVMSVLSVYGSLDTVLNTDKVFASREYMPFDYSESVIEGGNHAQFGDYGEQKGDTAATISADEQVNITCELIESFINKQKVG